MTRQWCIFKVAMVLEFRGLVFLQVHSNLYHFTDDDCALLPVSLWNL